ncbi:MAG TPA: hypothetical protein VJU86_18680 [Pyrinomonadaceae bacterium]|nr:hypothetical protein [Pyrinomonadaceae bacterium]
MKRILLAAALNSALAASVLGGEIPTVGLTSQDPDETISSTSPGEVPTVGYEGEISDLTLDLFQLMLGLVI